MPRDPRETPPNLELHHEAREPEWDPALGIDVEVDRSGQPAHRLVTIGDSLTHGFMSAAIFRTDLSWPAIVAHELGLRGDEFRYPTYEPPNGPGGLPFDLERVARAFESRFGSTLDWHEVVKAPLWLRRYMDAVEDHWERGPGSQPTNPSAPFHNLGMYGWDVLDVLHTTIKRVEDELAVAPRDNWVKQGVQQDSARAARPILESCAFDGTPRTVVQAAEVMSREGAGAHGIETLVVMLGSNHALGSCLALEPRWTPDDYLQRSDEDRLAEKGAWNVWQPEHFAAEWATLVDQLRAIRARHVIVATVPAVTVAPITRGSWEKEAPGSRYFRYYTRPWIDDADFQPERDPHLTGAEARAIDSAIDAYNATIIESVRAARRDGLDWYVLDTGGILERLASRRYLHDRSAQPSWWRGPYPLPDEVAALDPVPDTRFFRSGPTGRAEGGLFSLDGVHPTTIGYGIIADEVMAVMSAAGVSFPHAGAGGRARVDFGRVLAADTLNGRSPACVTGALELLGWLDEAVDWVARLVP